MCKSLPFSGRLSHTEFAANNARLGRALLLLALSFHLVDAPGLRRATDAFPRGAVDAHDEIVSHFVQFGQNARHRLVERIEQMIRSQQPAIFLNALVSVKLVQQIVRIRCGFDVVSVTVDGAVHLIQEVISLKFRRVINVFIHQISHGAFGATERTVRINAAARRIDRFGNATGVVVEIVRAPETGRFLLVNLILEETDF